MTKILLSAVSLVALMMPAAFADTLSIKASAKIVIPLGLSPVFESPVSGGFPISYLEPSDTCQIDSTRFDTANVEWVFVKSNSRSGWLQKSSVRQVGLPSSAPQSRGLKLDADAKRRYRILEQHPEWERRIVKVIREGNICLDMNDVQVLAAWGEPIQKSMTFILGAGKQDLWFYKGPSGKFETVFFVKGRVVGWSD